MKGLLKSDNNLDMDYIKILSAEFNITETHAGNIIGLLDEGCTIPFIARYRKEMTGSCDDQVLRDFSDRLTYLRNFEERKNDIIKLITEQEKMTPEIMESLEKANTMTELEDIYRPFKPKRQTRATIAVAKGLEPLADFIMAQKPDGRTLEELASEYINPEKEVNSAQEAINGAKDIIAEKISDDSDLRKELREFMQKSGSIASTIKKQKERLDNAKSAQSKAQ